MTKGLEHLNQKNSGVENTWESSWINSINTMFLYFQWLSRVDFVKEIDNLIG